MKTNLDQFVNAFDSDKPSTGKFLLKVDNAILLMLILVS
jgi:hypothetical protein